MPFSILTNEQILGFLAEQPRMMKVPGVALVWAEFADADRSQIKIAVSVYADEDHEIWRLPLTVAGLPVVVKVEDRRTGEVLEVIDPREHGGVWPRTNHQE